VALILISSSPTTTRADCTPGWTGCSCAGSRFASSGPPSARATAAWTPFTSGRCTEVGGISRSERRFRWASGGQVVGRETCRWSFAMVLCQGHRSIHPKVETSGMFATMRAHTVARPTVGNRSRLRTQQPHHAEVHVLPSTGEVHLFHDPPTSWPQPGKAVPLTWNKSPLSPLSSGPVPGSFPSRPIRWVLPSTGAWTKDRGW
jgi:hypothetical protein